MIARAAQAEIVVVVVAVVVVVTMPQSPSTRRKRRLNFPCQKRKEASSCRLRDRWSALLFREVGGACVLIALFLSGMRWRTYALLLNTGGALSMFSGASSLQSS